MILRLAMPFVHTSVEWGSVERWHVSAGDPIRFGTDVCDLVITEIKKLSRSAAGDKITSQRVMFRVRITASEPAILRQIQADRGSPVNIGDLLALVSTEPDELLELSPASPLLRVVADRLDADDNDDH